MTLKTFLYVIVTRICNESVFFNVLPATFNGITRTNDTTVAEGDLQLVKTFFVYHPIITRALSVKNFYHSINLSFDKLSLEKLPRQKIFVHFLILATIQKQLNLFGGQKLFAQLYKKPVLDVHQKITTFPFCLF